jgi:peptide/nickel transport system permease protein
LLKYLARRVLGSIPVLAVASFITFWLVRRAIDPLAKYRHTRDAEAVMAQQRTALGLNHPVIVQWWSWLTHFIRGDWGTSSRTQDAVSAMIQHALWPSLQLLFWATIASVLVALALGTYSAVKQYSAGDYLFTGLSYLGIAMPDFFFALLAIGVLVTWPAVHFHLNGPILYSIGLHTEVMRHAFRNALIPFTTVTALDTAFLISGVIVTEKIFSISGMGQAFLTALGAGDAPFLLAWFVITSVAVIAMNLLTDVAYVVLDPRIRLT